MICRCPLTVLAGEPLRLRCVRCFEKTERRRDERLLALVRDPAAFTQFAERICVLSGAVRPVGVSPEQQAAARMLRKWQRWRT